MVRWEVEAGESLRTCSKLAFLAYKAVNGRDHTYLRQGDGKADMQGCLLTSTHAKPMFMVYLLPPDTQR